MYVNQHYMTSRINIMKQPLWTAMILYLWKDEHPDSGTLIGGAFILLGVIIIAGTRPQLEVNKDAEQSPSNFHASQQYETFNGL